MKLIINKSEYLKNKDKFIYNSFVKWDKEKLKYIKIDNEFDITTIDKSYKEIRSFLIETITKWPIIYKKKDSNATVSSYKDEINQATTIIKNLKDNQYIYVCSKEFLTDDNTNTKNVFGIAIAERNDNNTTLILNLTYPYAQLNHLDRPNGTIGESIKNLRNYAIQENYKEPSAENMYINLLNTEELTELFSIGFDIASSQK